MDGWNVRLMNHIDRSKSDWMLLDMLNKIDGVRCCWDVMVILLRQMSRGEYRVECWFVECWMTVLFSTPKKCPYCVAEKDRVDLVNMRRLNDGERWMKEARSDIMLLRNWCDGYGVRLRWWLYRKWGTLTVGAAIRQNLSMPYCDLNVRCIVGRPRWWADGSLRARLRARA